MSFQGKVVIITNCVHEIGLATARAFILEGARIIISGSRKDAVRESIASLKAAFPNAPVTGVALDLSIWQEVQEFFRNIQEKYGSVDILINISGLTDSTPLQKCTEENYDKIMEQNLKGVFFTSKAVTAYMVPQGHGVILNTSSVVSFEGQPCGAVYAASMSAINGFTLSLARELASKGIRVNAVAPGFTETESLKSLNDDAMRPLICQIPIGRLGKPEEIANAFVFLASEKATYISGIVLRVDGLAGM